MARHPLNASHLNYPWGLLKPPLSHYLHVIVRGAWNHEMIEPAL